MRNHIIIRKESGLPIVGVHTFGLIDRGTNIIQVRPISGCPLNCIYCSVDEGPLSKKKNTYEVELMHLVAEFNKLVEQKRDCINIEAHIDGVGEPLMYDEIVGLVRKIRENPKVKTISMQTNGVLLTDDIILSLANAGLNRINLSINSLDFQLSREIAATDWYNINKIMRAAEKIKEHNMELLIAPVLIPKINENAMDEIIEYAKQLSVRIGIQKFEASKHGRKPKHVKEQTWYAFNKQMRMLEKKHSYKLLYSKEDFGITKCASLPIVFKKEEKVSGKVVLPGWLSNEVIISSKNRLITVYNSKNSVGDMVRGKITKIKHNIYLAKKI